jgi:hypothetical protein
MLKPRTHPKLGYVQAAIYQSEYKAKYPLLHRLVAAAFIGEIPAKHQVNHKNGNRSDNRVENLEIVTASQNNLHAFRVLGRKAIKGSKHPNSVLTETDVLTIREQHSLGVRQMDLARFFRIDPTTVRDVVHRYKWTHV